MTLVNTLFHHRITRRTTRHSPDGVTYNEIDYILAKSGYSNPVSTEPKTKSFQGAEINSDHDLVIVTLKQKLKKKTCGLTAQDSSLVSIAKLRGL